MLGATSILLNTEQNLFYLFICFGGGGENTLCKWVNNTLTFQVSPPQRKFIQGAGQKAGACNSF